LPYTQITLADLEAALFQRLGDQVFYSNTGSFPECKLYINEALRVWNSLANFWRDRVVIQTTANQSFYKITDPAVVTNPPNLLVPTLTDSDLVAEIMYHLLESQPLQPDPIDTTTWRGTDMFTLPWVLGALTRRRDQFLHETAITLNNTLVSGVVSSEGRMNLPETMLDVRRVSWVDYAAGHNHLWRMDEWEAQAQLPTWAYNPEAPPTGFSLILTPPVRIQLVPPPALGGRLDMLSSNSGTALTGGVLLGIPDDWAWAIKWGALADLLSNEGQGKDPDRAAYCEERFQQALAVARHDPDVLWAQVNGRPVTLMALQDLDSGYPTWQDETGTPAYLAVERDMVAVYPVPDGVYSVTLDVLRPAPIPVLSTDVVQFGPEILDTIIAYAQHIAAFKEGGAEFASTKLQFNDLLRLAADYNSKLSALAVFRDVLEDRSTRDEDRTPRRAQEVSQ
jgi:hypothetical protein